MTNPYFHISPPAPTASTVRSAPINAFAAAVESAFDMLPPPDELGGGAFRPEFYGAVGDGVTDDRAAFQAAIDGLQNAGGGTLYLSEKTYRLASVISVNCVVATTISAGALVPGVEKVYLRVPAGVSIVGKGSDKSKIVCSSASGATLGLGMVEYANGCLKGFSLTGWSATSNAAHGVWFSIVQDATHVNSNILVEDLHINLWGSYGIGHEYGHVRDFVVRNCLIEDTGADSIDHKVRFGPNDNNWGGAVGVSYDQITCRRHGQRLTACSGMDMRGPSRISDIQVLEVSTDNFGITLSGGIHQLAETRTPSARTVLSNFRVEAIPTATGTIGVHLLSGGPSVVESGYVHWFRIGVQAKAESASPSGWRDGSSISNVIVEGSRGGHSFQLDQPRTQLIACRSLGDTQYFDEKRGYTINGATTFAVQGGIEAGLIAYLNGVVTTAFTTAGGNIIMNAPLTTGDKLVVCNPTLRAVRINADYCSIVGGGNGVFHTAGMSFQDQSNIDTGAASGYLDELAASMMVRNNAGLVHITPSGTGANADLLIGGRGTGVLRYSSPFVAAATPANFAADYMIQIRSDDGTLHRVPAKRAAW